MTKLHPGHIEWVVSNSVAGAEGTNTVRQPTKSLRDVKVVIHGDWPTGCSEHRALLRTGASP